MILLEHAESQLRECVRRGDEAGAVKVFFQVVFERTEAMHQRAQTAESRAHKAERDLDRFARTVDRFTRVVKGNVEDEACVWCGHECEKADG